MIIFLIMIHPLFLYSLLPHNKMLISNLFGIGAIYWGLKSLRCFLSVNCISSAYSRLLLGYSSDIVRLGPISTQATFVNHGLIVCLTVKLKNNSFCKQSLFNRFPISS